MTLTEYKKNENEFRNSLFTILNSEDSQLHYPITDVSTEVSAPSSIWLTFKGKRFCINIEDNS